MHRFPSILIAILTLAISQPGTTWAATNELHYRDYTTVQLKTRLAEIDAELAGLARFTPRTGTGTIGWISTRAGSRDRREWVEIALPENTPIDQIVLVPLLWNDAQKGLQADGFPEVFDVIIGNKDRSEIEVIARFGPEDRLLPRTAPLVIPIPKKTASWMRIKATRLMPDAREGNYIFCLSEIMVFNGDRNVALAQPVQVSSEVGGWGVEAINKDALTDGFTPFLMDASSGTDSNPHLAFFPENHTYSFTLDLGSTNSVDEIRIHSADMSEYVPQLGNSDFGVPYHLVIEGANRPDFSDAVALLDYRRESIYESGAILIRHVPETRCRHIRLSIPEPYQTPYMPAGRRRNFGLAELEIISNGRNVAQGTPPVFSRQKALLQQRNSITDGSNHYGEILPIRKWIEQLARRHDLERERPLLAAELEKRYDRQQSTIRRMIGLAILLAVGIVISLLIGWIVRMRAVLNIRERIAANLHDELGANLHAIGLLGDMAKNKVDARDTLLEILDRIRQLTERSGKAARHCANLLEAKELCADLTEEMKHSSDRLLADAEHNLTFEGVEFIHRLTPRKRIDLFLFYKECLTNIVRHSHATCVTTRLTGSPKEIHLIITDNGQGLRDIPRSLKRRAHLLRAKLGIENPPTGGTCIALKLKTKICGFKPLRLKESKGS
ncbi:sensor histidine kinase [Pontiella sp.]|uniref:sensor histidine kinase n=1 Tax=Pontiella sp. TaxID=2837462 RepID=UPI0035642132